MFACIPMYVTARNTPFVSKEKAAVKQNEIMLS